MQILGGGTFNMYKTMYIFGVIPAANTVRVLIPYINV